MAPKYTLNYFNFRGIAEPLRLTFAYKGVEYTDNRINKADWPELKAKQPFGKLPTLEVDGVVLAESQAIIRFVARELGLAGKDNLESAKCDMLADSFKDAFQPFSEISRETDEAKQKELWKTLFTETLTPFYAVVGTFLKDNGGTYYVGKDITWIDFSIAYYLNEIRQKHPLAFDKFPLISAHIDRIHSLPAIKAWVEKRPKTDK